MENDKKDGTKGFSTQLAGHGKAGKSNTSSFDSGPPDYTIPGYVSGDKIAKNDKREPTTSSVVRVVEKKPE